MTVTRLEPANMTPSERGLWLVHTDPELRDRMARNIFEAKRGGWRLEGAWEALSDSDRDRLREDLIRDLEEDVRRERTTQAPELFRRVRLCLTCTNDAPIHLYCDDCMDAITAHRDQTDRRTHDRP